MIIFHFQGGIVNVNKLDSVLKTMGWKLTEDEIKDLKCNLPADGEHVKKIFLSSLGKSSHGDYIPSPLFFMDPGYGIEEILLFSLFVFPHLKKALKNSPFSWA